MYISLACFHWLEREHFFISSCPPGILQELTPAHTQELGDSEGRGVVLDWPTGPFFFCC